MDAQDLLNVMYGLFSFMGMIIVGGLSWAITNLFQMVRGNKEAIHALDIKIEGNYVPRPELQATFQRFGDKLDEITRCLRERNSV